MLHLFLKMEGRSEGLEGPSEYCWVSLTVIRQPTESGSSYRCYLTPLAPVLQFHSNPFQTVGWMASHFDDLFKQFVRSTTSCMSMIQNINACCRCNFSCQLMHQEKITFIPERCNFFTNTNLQCPGGAIGKV